MHKAYLSLNDYLRRKFGEKVYKISLSINGLTCPNRDGTCGTGGCIFCLGGSGDFAENIDLYENKEYAIKAVCAAIEKGKLQCRSKAPNCRRFIAYFQSFTNTYAPAKLLRNVFYAAICHPDIVCLSVATRPDCLPGEIVNMLSELNKIKPVWVELGLQTANDNTALLINRGYESSVYKEAAARLRYEKIEFITHMIIGLPGEDFSDYTDTLKYALSAGTRGVKFQVLNILTGTKLEEMYANGFLKAFDQDEYVDTVVKLVSMLPSDVVVHRLTGDGNRAHLIAPRWALDKRKTLNMIAKRISR